jgi:hypothetical protein
MGLVLWVCCHERREHGVGIVGHDDFPLWVFP